MKITEIDRVMGVERIVKLIHFMEWYMQKDQHNVAEIRQDYGDG